MSVRRRRAEASGDALPPALRVAGPRESKAQPGSARMGKKRALTSLSEATIVDTARRLIRQVGVDDLSMRMLAKELGVSPMAVYYHVADKGELLTKVREAIIGRVRLELPAGASWEAQVRAYATASILSLADYPGLLFHGAMRPPTPAEVKMTHDGVAILIAAGFEPNLSARAITSFHCALLGLAAAYRQTQLEPVPERPVGKGDPQASQQRLGFREALDFTIDTFVKGLRVQLLEQPAAPKRARRARTP